MSSTASAPLPAPRTGARAGAFARLLRSPMLRFIGRRLLVAIPVLWGVTFLTFVVVNHLPGNAAQEQLGINATPQELHQLSLQLGLNKPLLTRYWEWLHGLLQGSLGHSLANGQSVTSVLAGDLPVTFELVAFSLLIALVFALPIALLAAWRPGGIFDRTSLLLS